MLMTIETTLQNPVAAVTYPDPYPFYRRLLAERPLYYDDAPKAWVATSAEAVRGVLTSPLCRVRPTREPVPSALVGSSAAEVFGKLVRMNDGDHHQPFKGAVRSALDSLDAVEIGRLAGLWAERLFDQLRPDESRCGLTDFCFQLSGYVVGSLLGVADDDLAQTVAWTSQYVAGVTPAANTEAVEQGKAAAGHLLDQFHALLNTPPSSGLLGQLAAEARQVGRDDAQVIAANGIGFLSQAYEATAGLIGNALVKLARDSKLRQQIEAYPDLLNAVVQEVLRADSPVQNTRRFLAESGVVAGQEMGAGDMIVVVLAAANHDPAANPHPGHFDLFRKMRQIFTFGVGVHACPGERLVSSIALAGVMQLIEADLPLEPLAEARYRPSGNVRIPLFE